MKPAWGTMLFPMHTSLTFALVLMCGHLSLTFHRTKVHVHILYEVFVPCVYYLVECTVFRIPTAHMLVLSTHTDVQPHSLLCTMYNSLDTIPSCPSNVVVYASADGVNVTWQQPSNSPLVAFTSVTFYLTSSPNCGNSINYTSPCALSGLDSGTEYQFTVLPNNYKCYWMYRK